MLSYEQSQHFAQEWISAWNSRDIEQIIQHYTEDIVFYSPFIVSLKQIPKGCIEGKMDLKAYFSTALQNFPDLHFEFHNVFAGVNSLVIYYKSVKNYVGTEMMILDENLQIKQVFAHYKTV